MLRCVHSVGCWPSNALLSSALFGRIDKTCYIACALQLFHTRSIYSYSNLANDQFVLCVHNRFAIDSVFLRAQKKHGVCVNSTISHGRLSADKIVYCDLCVCVHLQFWCVHELQSNATYSRASSVSNISQPK